MARSLKVRTLIAHGLVPDIGWVEDRVLWAGHTPGTASTFSRDFSRPLVEDHPFVHMLDPPIEGIPPSHRVMITAPDLPPLKARGVRLEQTQTAHVYIGAKRALRKTRTLLGAHLLREAESAFARGDLGTATARLHRASKFLLPRETVAKALYALSERLNLALQSA